MFHYVVDKPKKNPRRLLLIIETRRSNETQINLAGETSENTGSVTFRMLSTQERASTARRKMKFATVRVIVSACSRVKKKKLRPREIKIGIRLNWNVRPNSQSGSLSTKNSISRWRLSIAVDYWYYYPLKLPSRGFHEFSCLCPAKRMKETGEMNLISSQFQFQNEWPLSERRQWYLSRIYRHQTSRRAVERKNSNEMRHVMLVISSCIARAPQRKIDKSSPSRDWVQ